MRATTIGGELLNLMRHQKRRAGERETKGGRPGSFGKALKAVSESIQKSVLEMGRLITGCGPAGASGMLQMEMERIKRTRMKKSSRKAIDEMVPALVVR